MRTRRTTTTTTRRRDRNTHTVEEQIVLLPNQRIHFTARNRQIGFLGIELGRVLNKKQEEEEEVRNK
jgi:hypothetical protein